MEKKLYRSKKNRMIAGVCGGLGEYFNIDPTIMRLAAVALIFASGAGLIAYIIGWIIIPERKEEETGAEVPVSSESTAKLLPGLILIVVGVVFLINNLFFWFHFSLLWPLILIALGIFILLSTGSASSGKA
jgi:phage shock protein PspC (stress-responsive transcriptional regulator)